MPIPPVSETGSIVPKTKISTTSAGGWWQEEPVWISDRYLLEIEWVCFVLYAFVGVLAFLLLLRTPRPPSVSTSAHSAPKKEQDKEKEQDALGLRMRRLLAMGIFAASVVRCLSLLMEIENQEGNLSTLHELGPRQVQWLWDLISLLPAVAFMSAFSVVVAFMAQLHYIMSMVSLPLLDCFVVWLNVACYFLVLAVAVGTYLLCAYEHLRAYLSCLIGFLYAVLSWSLMYYGIMIMNQLGDALRKGHPAQLPVLRVLLVSVLCPLMLLIRAVCMICWGCSMASPSTSVDLILCLCSEWFPAVVIELSLIPAHTFVMAEDFALLDSSESEVSAVGLQEPLLESRDADIWKQLYPAPPWGTPWNRVMIEMMSPRHNRRVLMAQLQRGRNKKARKSCAAVLHSPFWTSQSATDKKRKRKSKAI